MVRPYCATSVCFYSASVYTWFLHIKKKGFVWKVAQNFIIYVTAILPETKLLAEWKVANRHDTFTRTLYYVLSQGDCTHKCCWFVCTLKFVIVFLLFLLRDISFVLLELWNEYFMNFPSSAVKNTCRVCCMITPPFKGLCIYAHHPSRRSRFSSAGKDDECILSQWMFSKLIFRRSYSWRFVV